MTNVAECSHSHLVSGLSARGNRMPLTSRFEKATIADRKHSIVESGLKGWSDNELIVGRRL
jgi:hypothetical protein